ncbi:ABC transporter substrate-binding protein [Gynuella sp.]|uniref:ABC transporter substrate-binding protein n=1 Tax=Gynuella sp. TaxID=2969146 RepID=UPI003D10985A
MKKQPLLLPVILSVCMAAGGAMAKTELHLQRFFGACDAQYGTNTDVDKAEGECGIMTSLINQFSAEHPDIKVKVTTVEWPGYDQLTAQMASRTPPDLVTMHNSVISDYQSRRLILPIDDLMKQVGISLDDFTDTAARGIVKEGQVYGLPIDTWTMLFHINMKLMKQAGLVTEDGQPVLPHSPEELLQQARQFKKATGKPYLVQILSNETSAYTRLFYTYMFEQNSDFFADPNKISLQSDKARNIVKMLKQIYDEDLTTKNMDYPATVSGFTNGDGGILMNGNWLLGAFEVESHNPDSEIYNAYMAVPYPQLFQNDKLYVDGHSWVMPNKKRNKAELAATAEFFKFMKENDYQWSRTGHLPSVKSVLSMPEFLQLPHRQALLGVTTRGTGLPEGVKRQFAVQDILGEELAAAVTGVKPIDEALKEAERRINDMLANL